MLASNGGAKLDVPAADGTLAATAEADEPAVEDPQGEGTIPSHRTVDTETAPRKGINESYITLPPPFKSLEGQRSLGSDLRAEIPWIRPPGLFIVL